MSEPQWDEAAEQSVLGGMMLDNTVIDEVLDEISPADFYQPKHELIARAIAALRNRFEPADPITVTEELRRSNLLDRAGGAAYLHQLTSLVFTAANAAFYARAVHEMAVKRRLVEVGMRIQAIGQASEGDVAELMERARAEVEGVSGRTGRVLGTIGESFPALIDELDRKPEYTPTPWEALNKLIGGFAPGTLAVFAARPGGGKSIALLQIAAQLAHHGMVALSSLEMQEAELQRRLLAQYGPVHMTALRNHNLSPDDWKRVAEARQKVQGAPIFVDDTPAVTLSQIRAHARAVARRGQLAAVAVDYLQLVRGEGDSRQEVVAAVAEGLKALAKDLQVPVIAAAQLRRLGEKRAGKQQSVPTLDDLRESGGIEQAADLVVLMDRDKERAPRDLQMVVAKDRNGETGRFTLQWQAQFSRLLDRHWTPTALIDEAELA